MWNLPGPGIEPVSPALAGGFSATVPPGKSYLFISWWTLGSFLYLAIMNNATMNFYLQVFLWSYAYIVLLGIYLGVELLGHMVTLWLTLWKWKSFIRVWLFVTSWTIQSMEFSRPEYWSGEPFPSPGDLPNLGIKSRSPTLQAVSLPAEPPEKPKNTGISRVSLLQWIIPTQGLSCIAGRFFTNWAIREDSFFIFYKHFLYNQNKYS